MRPAQALAALVVVILGLVAACAPTRPAPAPVAETEPPPLVTTAESGLEVHWWVSDDSDDRVARALARFTEEALPADSVSYAAWEANGLRLRRAPRTGFIELQAALPPIQLRSRQWIGWVTEWTEVFRGRRIGSDSIVLVDAQRRALPRGTPRLLLRAWPTFTPDPLDPADVRVEIAIQHHTAPERRGLERPDHLPPQREGEVFRALTLSLRLDPESIYIITAEAPGVTWQARDEGAPDAAAPPADEPSEPGSFGPPAALPLTIGQAMLTRPAQESAGVPARAVIVLLPRSPDRFRLLP